MSDHLVKYYGVINGNAGDSNHQTLSCEERFEGSPESPTRVHYIRCNGVEYKALGSMVCVNLTAPKNP